MLHLSPPAHNLRQFVCPFFQRPAPLSLVEVLIIDPLCSPFCVPNNRFRDSLRNAETSEARTNCDAKIMNSEWHNRTSQLLFSQFIKLNLDACESANWLFTSTHAEDERTIRRKPHRQKTNLVARQGCSMRPMADQMAEISSVSRARARLL